MGNVSRFKIIKLYWLDEPFGQGVDEKGHYIVFRLDFIIDTIFYEGKEKEFQKLWEKKIEEIKMANIDKKTAKKIGIKFEKVKGKGGAGGDGFGNKRLPKPTPEKYGKKKR